MSCIPRLWVGFVPLSVYSPQRSRHTVVSFPGRGVGGGSGFELP